nr:hypothetical protein [Paraburkholderia xenovorans]
MIDYGEPGNTASTRTWSNAFAAYADLPAMPVNTLADGMLTIAARRLAAISGANARIPGNMPFAFTFIIGAHSSTVV